MNRGDEDINKRTQKGHTSRDMNRSKVDNVCAEAEENKRGGYQLR